MRSAWNHWTTAILSASVAVEFAATGLGLEALYPGAAPIMTSTLFIGSIGCTGIAFIQLVLRVRRLELENEGLIEEVSQEFDRVKTRLDVYGEAANDLRSLSSEDASARSSRRVLVK